MSDYNYIIGSLFGLILFLVILGNFGAADDIYGDRFDVYDSELGENPSPTAESSFDIERLRFNPEVPQPDNQFEVGPLGSDLIVKSDSIEERSELVYGWNGNTSDGNVTLGDSELPSDDEYGYIVWDVTERTDEFAFTLEDDVNVDIRYRDANGFEQELSTATTPDTYEINFSGDGLYDGSGNELANLEVFQLAFTSEDASADVGGGEFTSQTSIFNLFGPVEVVARYLVAFFDGTFEIANIFVSYIDFTTEIPGMLGSFLRFYMGIFIPVLLIKELWLG